MKKKITTILSVLAIGAVGVNAQADNSARPSALAGNPAQSKNIKEVIVRLLEEGVIVINPETGKLEVASDIEKELKDLGIYQEASGSNGSICF